MKRANRTQTPMDGEEKREARRREMPSAAVVFEAIRNTAEAELQRPLLGLAWSALAAGLSMGFSFVAQSLLYHHTLDSNWRTIVSSFGYAVGFLFVILGRQQLFTENTLTPVLEVLRVRSMRVVYAITKLWLVVLCMNILGTAVFAAAIAGFRIFEQEVQITMASIAHHEYAKPFSVMFVQAIFAGWLVALMLWLMPFAETARVGVIIVVSFVIGLAHFPHVVAGSVAAFYAVFTGEETILAYLGRFFAPTILGNMVGGIMLVAAVNYAQVAYSDPENHK
ncbi:MAG: formate/nitrite transporter family protein [Pseudomonadota bacterium]|nr:formate/nitrite transporter family protein [Pseudomonadota bacterium]